MTDAPPTQPLLDMLAPVTKTVASLDPSGATDDAATAKLLRDLEEAWPFDGEAVQAIGNEIRRGVAEGWLCDRGEPDARFCRVAKATPDTQDLSIDIVALSGAALRHTHPRGEVTMAFPAEPAPADAAGRFDGHAPGWVVMAAGSTHTPTVAGPRMHLLYFLPGGKVEWHPG
ncbi:MAG: DUF4863 family protein [Myxococcota bacterium]